MKTLLLCNNNKYKIITIKIYIFALNDDANINNVPKIKELVLFFL